MKTRYAWPLLLLLVACQEAKPSVPPTVQITSPTEGQSVAGSLTVSLNAASPDGVKRVDLYVRAAGSKTKGVLIGGASSAPYQVGWATFTQPSGAALELYGEATGSGGATGQSVPVPLQIGNSGTPTLNYFAAISYPAPAAQALGSGRRPFIEPWKVTPPARPQTASNFTSQTLKTLALGARQTDLEWGWSPVTGADGYGVYLATGDLAGPYERRRAQAAGPGAQQGYATSMPGQPGDRYFGAVSTVTGSAESGLGNAVSAVILPEPQPASPAEGQTVSGGRPTLSWVPTPGAAGYLYYVYPQPPQGNTVKPVWTNYPATSGSAAAAYPSSLAPLASGTYYWRVAAVSYDAASRANSFSFSAVHRFTVP